MCSPACGGAKPFPNLRAEMGLEHLRFQNYNFCMTKNSDQTTTHTKTGRSAKTGRFVPLKDGRKLVAPPSGGKFTKRQIKHAVRTVLAARRDKAAAG